jgi:hypothetical protein
LFYFDICKLFSIRVELYVITFVLKYKLSKESVREVLLHITGAAMGGPTLHVAWAAAQASGQPASCILYVFARI